MHTKQKTNQAHQSAAVASASYRKIGIAYYTAINNPTLARLFLIKKYPNKAEKIEKASPIALARVLAHYIKGNPSDVSVLSIHPDYPIFNKLCEDKQKEQEVKFEAEGHGKCHSKLLELQQKYELEIERLKAQLEACRSSKENGVVHLRAEGGTGGGEHFSEKDKRETIPYSLAIVVALVVMTAVIGYLTGKVSSTRG